ncbi:MAG TPA: galactonate dehydratase [Aggregatilineales bacterium]|nr:galactonate dehydratase [Aggregatilineales bacterium]
MKITRLETIFVKPRWLFLKMFTDDGLCGLGEPIVEGRARTVATAVKELESYLIGQDPRHIERHWQAMYRGTFYRGGPILVSAISGLEQAMWDILGKSLGVPVYQLLGGPVRDRVRVYAHCGGDTPELAAQAARERVAQGYTALKTSIDGPVRIVETKAYLDGQVQRIQAMRQAIPDNVDLAVDFHGRVGPAMAIRLANALEDCHLMFIEEPVLPENVDALVTVARSTSIPIATGERLFTRWGFREVLEKQAAAIVQPDLCHAGGILEVRKIAAMAEVYYAAVAPHNPLGPISLAAGLQLDACIPNFLCQEQVSFGEGYLKQPFVFRDGYLDLPTAPGLGIELDDEQIAAQEYDGSWQTPVLAHPDDGSLADW